MYDDATRDSDGFIILKPTYSSLYKKTNYTTSSPKIINDIYEYDIKAANLAMLRQYCNIDPEVLADLERMPKQSREVAVGKMIRREHKFHDIISKGIRKAREELFRTNNIQDTEVVSIKNDAVFIVGRKLKNLVFGPIEFRVKHRYSLFMKLGKMEFYYDKRHDSVDIKGVRDATLKEPDHKKGMLKFFSTIFKFECLDQYDEIREYILDFIHDYKNKDLPIQYYRELNGDNSYSVIYDLSGYRFNLIYVGESSKAIINPIYNYMTFILPMLRLYI